MQSQRNVIFKRRPERKDDMLFSVLGFTKGKRFTEDFSLLALVAIDFPEQQVP